MDKNIWDFKLPDLELNDQLYYEFSTHAFQTKKICYVITHQIKQMTRVKINCDIIIPLYSLL